MARKYFAASNSSEGFKSYYDSVFSIDKLSRLYIIKGGPGTGKSYFMKRAGQIAEECGYSVDYIYCSSDPSSLDGIIVDELCLAMLDGTSPHAYEAKLPGAAEEIVDLGAFWNPAILGGSRKTIECLSKKKSACFARAYSYLGAVKKVSEALESLVMPYIKKEKMQKFARRIADSLEGGECKTEYMLANSVGMQGNFGFDNYYENSEIYFAINDIYDIGFLLLRELADALKSKSCSIAISPNPILPERLDAILLKESKTAFEISKAERQGVRSINMKRFIEFSEMGEARSDIRMACRMRDNLSELAVRELEKAKKYHFTLEEIYGNAMDFSAKEQFSNDLFKKLLPSKC